MVRSAGNDGVAVVVQAKIARIAWAMPVSGESYRARPKRHKAAKAEPPPGEEQKGRPGNGQDQGSENPRYPCAKLSAPD
jgi:hypothetical protein